jgi:CRISPR-associated protein Csm2
MKGRIDAEVESILEKIKQLEMLKDLKEKDFADENGYADTIANNLRGMKTTQLRKFFDSIREIKEKLKKGSWEDVEADFYLLKPKIAHARGRNLIPEEFNELMKVCMKKVDIGEDTDKKKKNFEKMVAFLEAVVAYHRYYNPRG